MKHRFIILAEPNYSGPDEAVPVNVMVEHIRSWLRVSGMHLISVDGEVVE